MSPPPAWTTGDLKRPESRSSLAPESTTAPRPEKRFGCEGRDVVIVGGGNSAGQAALHMAEHAQAVTVVVRGPSLARGMSNYLVERIDQHPRITVRTSPGRRSSRRLPPAKRHRSAARGTTRLEELPADAMFLLIGARPFTTGRRRVAQARRARIPPHRPRRRRGDDRDTWWKLNRDPYPLESSQPGVFVAGDLRHGSIKRVASAVGEGAMAASLIHRYLALNNGDRP